MSRKHVKSKYNVYIFEQQTLNLEKRNFFFKVAVTRFRSKFMELKIFILTIK